MHIQIQAAQPKTIMSILDALLKDQTPEDSVLMVSCSKSSGQYRATVDIGGPEADVT